jgi:hypothetical protein
MAETNEVTYYAIFALNEDYLISLGEKTLK